MVIVKAMLPEVVEVVSVMVVLVMVVLVMVIGDGISDGGWQWWW